jgi:hypothetical protein
MNLTHQPVPVNNRSGNLPWGADPDTIMAAQLRAYGLRARDVRRLGPHTVAYRGLCSAEELIALVASESP